MTPKTKIGKYQHMVVALVLQEEHGSVRRHREVTGRRDRNVCLSNESISILINHPQRKQKTYLPLGDSGLSTKVPHEVFAGGDIGNSQPDWYDILVYNDQTDFPIRHGCIVAQHAFIGLREVHLHGRATEVLPEPAR